MLGGEFNGVRTTAGGDVDLQTTGNTDFVGTIAAIDGNRSKAIATTAEVGLACTGASNCDLVVAGPAVGGDINSTVVAISGATDGQFVVAFSALKDSMNRCCLVA